MVDVYTRPRDLLPKADRVVFFFSSFFLSIGRGNIDRAVHSRAGERLFPRRVSLLFVGFVCVSRLFCGERAEGLVRGWRYARELEVRLLLHAELRVGFRVMLRVLLEGIWVDEL